ncbi:sodium-dependent glucose transporter 1-like [Bradysia coprophila]|uniref:sodium-dependent glucose transporter 1-like n=1 Tax=Bradysia coprophila TaxID=38358 RepID=UPI00187DA38C|nr:sodium-dependent glucose transporter 1-like [Bradysia coprophila]
MATSTKPSELPLSRKLKILTTAAIFLGNVAFGCSTTSLCSILENMRLKYDTTIEDISVVLTVTTVLYCLGAIACGLVSKHINRQLIAIGSLMALAFGHYMAPHCPTKLVFFVVGGVVGTSLGFYDSTQLVWIIEIWQEASGPFIQTQHFCYAVGTIISPLVVAPFLKTDNNESNATAVSNTPSEEQSESRLYIPFSILGAFISLAFAFQIFLFVFYRYRTPPMYADENFKPIDDANNIMMEMEHNRREIDLTNHRESNATFGGMNVRRAKLIAVTTIFIGLYLAMEVSTMQFIQIFGQYSDLKMTQSASAYVLTALTVMFAIGRGIGIVIIFKIRPELIICLNLFLIAVANLILLVWANGSLSMFWTASILLGIGQSTTYPSFCAFMEKYLVFTSGIASLVVVVATIGGAVYPLIIGSIIEKNVIVLTYTNYFSVIVCVIVMAVGYKWTRNSKNRAR